MKEKALTVQKETELTAYGGRPEIRELTDRLMVMLPSAKDLGKAGAMALAQASLAMGLNPFIGEIWAIPQGRRNNDGTYDTYAIMVGINVKVPMSRNCLPVRPRSLPRNMGTPRANRPAQTDAPSRRIGRCTC